MLRLEVARGALLAMLRECDSNSTVWCHNTTQAEFDLLSSSVYWNRPDRHVVTKVYQTLLYSSMEFSGAEIFDAPAEWQAAVISTFVHPANWMSACSWLVPAILPAYSGSALDGSVDPVVAADVTAEDLFKLLCLLNACPEVSEYRACFEKSVESARAVRETKVVSK